MTELNNNGCAEQFDDITAKKTALILRIIEIMDTATEEEKIEIDRIMERVFNKQEEKTA